MMQRCAAIVIGYRLDVQQEAFTVDNVNYFLGIREFIWPYDTTVFTRAWLEKN